jgi:RNA polymerase sigma-70 factor (ECF subfamily)
MQPAELKFRTSAAEPPPAGFAGLSGYVSDDAVLIREAQAGKWESFVEVASHYDRAILVLALRLAGCEREARNLFQQALLRTYRELRNYRFQCSFYLWIYRIVARTCMEFLARQTPAHSAQASHIQEALEQLSPRERLVFELKHYFGLKLDTVAVILEIDETTARNILLRATLAVRLELEEHAIR